MIFGLLAAAWLSGAGGAAPPDATPTPPDGGLVVTLAKKRRRHSYLVDIRDRSGLEDYLGRSDLYGLAQRPFDGAGDDRDFDSSRYLEDIDDVLRTLRNGVGYAGDTERTKMASVLVGFALALSVVDPESSRRVVDQARALGAAALKAADDLDMDAQSALQIAECLSSARPQSRLNLAACRAGLPTAVKARRTDEDRALTAVLAALVIDAGGVPPDRTAVDALYDLSGDADDNGWVSPIGEGVATEIVKSLSRATGRFHDLGWYLSDQFVAALYKTADPAHVHAGSILVSWLSGVASSLEERERAERYLAVAKSIGAKGGGLSAEDQALVGQLDCGVRVRSGGPPGPSIKACLAAYDRVAALPPSETRTALLRSLEQTLRLLDGQGR